MAHRGHYHALRTLMDLRRLAPLAIRAVVVLAVIGAALVTGAQLKSVREASAAGQAATAPTPSPAPTPLATMAVPLAAPTVAPPMATATPPQKLHAATPSPTITPVTAAVITGRVTAGGDPVSRAAVRAYPAGDMARGPTPVPPESAEAVTDEEGRYSLTLPHGTYRVGAWLEGEMTPRSGHWWVTWYGNAQAIGLGKDLLVQGDAAGVDIAMLPALRVSGRVVGRDGIGVGGAQVFLVHTGFVQWDVANTRTDASGAFSLQAVPMAMKLMALASGTADASMTTIGLEVKGDVADIVATLDRGHLVSGILRDADGRPIKQTAYAVTAAGGSLACSTSCSGLTDPSGRYAVTLPAGTFRFATGPWNQPTHVSAEFTVSGDMSIDPVVAAR